MKILDDAKADLNARLTAGETLDCPCCGQLCRVYRRRLHAEMASGSYDAVVLPSIVTPDGETEGTPVSLVEALAHGLPVIASAIGGIPELLEGGCGILVPHSQPEALAKAIADLARHPETARALARSGYERVRATYEVGSVAEALLARLVAPT